MENNAGTSRRSSLEGRRATCGYILAMGANRLPLINQWERMHGRDADSAGRPRVVGGGVAGPVRDRTARAALPKVPEGFEVRLVAAVPAVLYPCQVATAPDGSLFVAEDPMDQVGPSEAKPIDRILLFRDGKEPVVFADGFNADLRHGLARRGSSTS